MKRRIVAAVVAVILAGLGAVVLLAYVAAADRRAMAGMETVSVLVVTKPIAGGTSAQDAAIMVAPKLLPKMAAAQGAVTKLDELEGKVAATRLQPGEQVLASRFVDPASLEKPGAVAIPAGMQQIAIQLEPQRVIGGSLQAGNTVGVFVTMKSENEPATTQLVLHKVLVSKVQGGIVEPAAAEGGESSETAAAPGGNVMVTLATTAANAQKIIFAAENAKIWLSLEPSNAVPGASRPVTEKNLYS
ncbi:MAG TPA: Flp pilus assembly protein CpaB [Dermatophilaceae bacterium]|nr:Flp pilus assembly protein CpaB [Dermatophilaceae bacterium]